MKIKELFKEEIGFKKMATVPRVTLTNDEKEVLIAMGKVLKTGSKSSLDEIVKRIREFKLEKIVGKLLATDESEEKAAEYAKKVSPNIDAEELKLLFKKCKMNPDINAVIKQQNVYQRPSIKNIWKVWSGLQQEKRFRQSVGLSDGYGEFTINFDVVVRGFGLNLDEDLKKIFTDGRFLGLLLEIKLCQSNGWQRATEENAHYDIKINDKNFEVRMMSVKQGGIYFNPANQRGKGRAFNLVGFYTEKLNDIDGYILLDTKDLLYNGRVRYYAISKELVEFWFIKGMTNKDTTISSDKLRALIHVYTDIPTLSSRELGEEKPTENVSV
jgi:hypothetical protein